LHEWNRGNMDINIIHHSETALLKRPPNFLWAVCWQDGLWEGFKHGFGQKKCPKMGV